MKLDSRRLLKYGEKMYIVSRIINGNDKPNISAWHSALGTDTVLEENGAMYFCESIIDVTDVEYITETETVDSSPETLPVDTPPDNLDEQSTSE
jgi:hypothetical protein